MYMTTIYIKINKGMTNIKQKHPLPLNSTSKYTNYTCNMTVGGGGGGGGAEGNCSNNSHEKQHICLAVQGY